MFPDNMFDQIVNRCPKKKNNRMRDFHQPHKFPSERQIKIQEFDNVFFKTKVRWDILKKFTTQNSSSFGVFIMVTLLVKTMFLKTRKMYTGVGFEIFNLGVCQTNQSE